MAGAVALLSVTVVAAQTGGTIDGRPIPEKFIKTCEALRSYVDEQAHQKAITEMGIVVTQADLDAERRLITFPDPVVLSNQLRARANLILPALSAVYDHGRDPHEVWEKTLKPNGISEDEWNVVYLKQGSTPAGREKIARQLLISPDALARGEANVNLTRPAALRKLDATVDQEIADKDPTFRAYLQRKEQAEADPQGHFVTLPELNYLGQKRREWWIAFNSRLDVKLYDPSLAQSCHLADMGIRP